MHNVLHFVRKNTQLKASFINNQISNHINYKPYIIYKEHRSNPFDGGFAAFNLKDYDYLDISNNETTIESLRNKTIKTISSRQIKQILEFIEQNHIKICHFHYGTDCGVYAPLLKFLPIPSVVSFYGYDCSSFPDNFFGFGKVFLKNRVFNHVTKVLAMSPDMKNDLIKAGCPEDKIIVHYYGTDVHRFHISDKLFENKKQITLLNLCSLVPQKGQMFLLQAIKNVISKGITNFILRIVGTGELEGELKEYVNSNTLNEYVAFVGAIPYGGAEMLEEYKNADIFIHPSIIAPNGDKEGIPGTVVEAMSSALPVISTYHAGIPFIIRHNETGLLVKENDIEALSLNIIELINNLDKRKQLGLAGQSFAMDHLDLQLREVNLENIYNSLI